MVKRRHSEFHLLTLRSEALKVDGECNNKEYNSILISRGAFDVVFSTRILLSRSASVLSISSLQSSVFCKYFGKTNS